jgi:hypothetical protein
MKVDRDKKCTSFKPKADTPLEKSYRLQALYIQTTVAAKRVGFVPNDPLIPYHVQVYISCHSTLGQFLNLYTRINARQLGLVTCGARLNVAMVYFL